MSETQMELTSTDPASRTDRELTELRAAMMSLPIQQQQAALAEYKERRESFRKWLLAQLVEGVHYGYPPGTEPKMSDDGKYVFAGKRRYHISQWKPKQSLYKAGADFIVDLMGLRPEYKTDMDAWQQLGGQQGQFVFACYLVSKSSGELVGEGRGARAVGQKGGDENNAIKMAKKSAKVDAVIEAYGLSDLFTQDLEDMTGREPHDNPTADDNAPTTQPRGERVTQEQVEAMITEYKCQHGDENPAKYVLWVAEVTGDSFDVRKPSQWTRENLEKCWKALGITA